MNAYGGQSPSESPLSPIPGGRQWFWFLFGLVFPLVALSPAVFAQLQLQWNQRAYRYVPFAIVLASLLLWRTCHFRPANAKRSAMAVAFVLGGMAFAMFGLYVLSPARVYLGAVIIVSGWALRAFGGTAWTRVLAICSLFVVTISIPFGFDIALMNAMHQLAASGCGSVLDAVGVPNVVDGNVLLVEGKRLNLVEVCRDAGSGIALIALAVAIVVTLRSSLFVSVLVIVFSIVTSVVSDLLRLIIITVSIAIWHFDWMVGNKPILLGCIVFFVSAILLLLFHTSMKAVFAPIELELSRRISTRLFNALCGWPAASATIPHDRFEFPKWFAPILLSLNAATISLGVLYYLFAPESTTAWASQPELGLERAEAFPGDETFPAQFGPLRKSKYYTESRPVLSLLGQHSHLWEFDGGETQVSVSLDFPFTSLSTVPMIYELLGWKVTDIRRLVVNRNSPITVDCYSLRNRFGLKGEAYHAYLDQRGTPILLPLEAGLRRSSNLLEQIRTRESKERSEPQSPYCQIQVLFESSTEISDVQVDERQTIFAMLFERIQQSTIPILAGPK